MTAPQTVADVLAEVVRHHDASRQNWEQGAVDAQNSGDRELATQIINGPLLVLRGFPIEQARAALRAAATSARRVETE